jgi:hypothetical protein
VGRAVFLGRVSEEAADYLRLTPSALYCQRYKGENPGALGIRVGKKVLYRPADIHRYPDKLVAEAHAWGPKLQANLQAGFDDGEILRNEVEQVALIPSHSARTHATNTVTSRGA